MGDEKGNELPPGLAAVWGLRERPTKGPKRGLSLEQIVTAAINVAAADGLAAVTMARVAAELGTGAMSLYRYVATKDELLALMIDTACGVPPAAVPAEDWRVGLTRWAWAYRAVLQRHPWILRVPISAPPITPNQLGWLEGGLCAVHDIALTEGQKLSVMLLLSGFVRSEAAISNDISAAARSAGTTEQEAMVAYRSLLVRLVDAQRFPALSAVIADGVLDEPDEFDSDFIFGLERILDGVAALAQSR